MRMRTVVAIAIGFAIAIATLSMASAQQEPPHRFYGHGATAGDEIGVHNNDDALTLIASTTVDENGSWYIDVDRDESEDVVFSINGKVAESEVSSTGSGQSNVSLTVAVMEEEDDSMMDEGDEDSMMEDGEMSDDDSMMEDDSMEDDSMEEDSMMDEGESMDSDDQMSDNGYPSTGSGGLADSGGVSAGLVGLLIALGAAAIAGVGVRRVRNRA